jgi:hypothetical protein
VSKLLLVEGRVYPGKRTWNWAHHQWLALQLFEHECTELAFIDLMAAIDGLLTRRQSLDERSPGSRRSHNQEEESRTTPLPARERGYQTGTSVPAQPYVHRRRPSESPIVTGDRPPINASQTRSTLDRTQEVAGSSPASSIA